MAEAKRRNTCASGGTLIFMSSSLGPIDLLFSAVGKTVSQLQVNEALIGCDSLFGHPLEILNHIF